MTTRFALCLAIVGLAAAGAQALGVASGSIPYPTATATLSNGECQVDVDLVKYTHVPDAPQSGALKTRVATPMIWKIENHCAAGTFAVTYVVQHPAPDAPDHCDRIPPSPPPDPAFDGTHSVPVKGANAQGQPGRGTITLFAKPDASGYYTYCIVFLGKGGHKAVKDPEVLIWR